MGGIIYEEADRSCGWIVNGIFAKGKRKFTGGDDVFGDFNVRCVPDFLAICHKFAKMVENVPILFAVKFKRMPPNVADNWFIGSGGLREKVSSYGINICVMVSGWMPRKEVLGQGKNV